MGPLKKFSQFCPAVWPAIGNIYIYIYVPRARYVDEVKHLRLHHSAANIAVELNLVTYCTFLKEFF